MKFSPLLFVGAVLICVSGCQSPMSSAPAGENVIRLLNCRDLSPFYSHIEYGTNTGPHQIFSVTRDGLLRISGEDYGYLATKKDFSNYKLVTEFKWGKKTWAPRLNNARDSGVLVHMQGKDGVWPKSLEAQIIEGGTGDILVVNGASLTVNGERKGPRTARFDRPGRNPWQDVKGFRGPNEIENPVGQWNRMEVLCEGEKFAIWVNGHKTLEGTNASPTSGKILLQSEGAEIFFRRLDVHPLK